MLKNSDLGILIVRKNHLIRWSIPITPHTPSSPTQVLAHLEELSNLTISAGGASYPILSLFFTYNVNQQAICILASRHHMPRSENANCLLIDIVREKERQNRIAGT